MQHFGILFFLILCTTSCNEGTIVPGEDIGVDNPKDSCVAAEAPIYLPGEMLHGRVTGLKNCLPFMASAFLTFYRFSDTLVVKLGVVTYEDWGMNEFVRKEIINVGAIASDTGTYSMYLPDEDKYYASYGIFKDFDVLEDVYRVDDSYDKNQITFSLLDTIEGRIQGYYNCRFLLASSSPSGNNPDTVVFKDCYFDAKEK